MSHKSVTEQIKHYQKDIDRHPENGERVIRCIQRLCVLPVSVQHLEETGIGKSVNALRKYGGEVAEAAKGLVTKWKAMVAMEVEAERSSERERENQKALSIKENRKHSSHEMKEKRLKEKDYNHYNGKEKRQRQEHDHYNGSEKRLKSSKPDSHSRSKEMKHNAVNHKSNADLYHKDNRSSGNYSSEHSTVDNHRRDRNTKEKENRSHKDYNGKSSHSTTENSHGKRKVAQVSDDDMSDRNIKRKRQDSLSQSESASDDERDGGGGGVSDGGGSGTDNDCSDREENIEKSESEEEEDEDESESEDDIPPNPYLDTFIKTEPESSEEELVALPDEDVEDSDYDKKSSRSARESDACSENSEEESERDMNEDAGGRVTENDDDDEVEDDDINNDNGRASRSSVESDESDSETRNSSISKRLAGHKEVKHTSIDNKKYSSHRETDKKRETSISRDEKFKHSSSVQVDKYSHNVKSSSSGGSKTNSSNSSSSNSSSKSRHSRDSSSSISVNSNKNSRSSTQTKQREKSKDVYKEEKSSRSLNNEVKQTHVSNRHKEDSHSSRSEKVDKHKNSLSSSKSSSIKLNDKSCSDFSKTKYATKSSSDSSGYSKIKKQADNHKSDYIKKEIKKEPEHNQRSHKKEQSKSSKAEMKTSSSENIKDRQETITIKTEKLSDNEDGICSGSGASFADALGMTEPKKKMVKKKPSAPIQKKPINTTSSSVPSKQSHQSNNSTSSRQSSTTSKPQESVNFKEPSLLKKSIKLEPLDKVIVASTLPEISPNYHPLPHYSPLDSGSKKAKTMSEDEALASIMSTKNTRTKVFSGNKSVNIGTVPSLYNLCIQVIQENVSGLEYTGGVPYDILKPILERMTPEQLYHIENYNPYLIEDTDIHWEFHCNRKFRGKKRDELESWRDLYLRCIDEQERKLKALTTNITQSIAQSTPIRKTKLAYVDSVVKPPRNVAKTQVKFGTAAAKHEIAARSVMSSQFGPTKTVVPSPVSPRSNHQSAFMLKKKKAPLMVKTLQLMKGFKR